MKRDATEIECILFESGSIFYLLPKNLVTEIIPLEKTAIFLRRTGLILGRQKYQAQIVPIISLQAETNALFTTIHPKLLIIHLVHPNQTSMMPVAILLDSDPTYFTVRREQMHLNSAASQNSNGTSVMIEAQRMVIPDLNHLAEAVITQL